MLFNGILTFQSLPIKLKVELQMLFKLIAAAKDSWACSDTLNDAKGAKQKG